MSRWHMPLCCACIVQGVRLCGSLFSERGDLLCRSVWRGRKKNTHINMLEDSFLSLLLSCFTSITTSPPISLRRIRAAMKDLRHVCAGDTLALAWMHWGTPPSSLSLCCFSLFFPEHFPQFAFSFRPPSTCLPTSTSTHVEGGRQAR